MLYTVRYKILGYHSQSYRFDDIECHTLKEAIESINLRGEITDGTVIIYKKLPKNNKVRCYYDDCNEETRKIRNSHKIGTFCSKFIPRQICGGHFDMSGINNIDNWNMTK